MGGACRCEEGWTGAGCDQRVCNPLCIKHGTCKDGKCQCHQGWNGEHCTIGKRVFVCARGGVCLMCVCVSTRGRAQKHRHPVRLNCQLLSTLLKAFGNKKWRQKGDLGEFEEGG